MALGWVNISRVSLFQWQSGSAPCPKPSREGGLHSSQIKWGLQEARMESSS